MLDLRIMNELEAIWEQTGLWPIALRLDSGMWFTVWGSGGGEEDVLLAIEHHLVLSRSVLTLYERLRRGMSGNLGGLPNFGTFLGGMPSLSAEHEVALQYPLAEVALWLQKGPATLSLSQIDATIDSLNLLWDAARTIEDDAIVGMLRPGRRPSPGELS